ncbi:MAG: hypothetical protein KBD37_09350, partial [Burkholderiales bacterium]|nr:hypothetical protein [Burkholderiales bacterium]
MNPSSVISLTMSWLSRDLGRDIPTSQRQRALKELTELISSSQHMEGEPLVDKVKKIFNLVNSKDFYCNEYVITEVGKFIASKPNFHHDEMEQLKTQHTLCLDLFKLSKLPHNQEWIKQVENIALNISAYKKLEILLKIFPNFIEDNEKESTGEEKILLNKFHLHLNYYSALLKPFKSFKDYITNHQINNNTSNEIEQLIQPIIQELENLMYNNPEYFNSSLGREIFEFLEHDIRLSTKANELLLPSTKDKLLKMLGIISCCNYLSFFHKPSDTPDPHTV